LDLQLPVQLVPHTTNVVSAAGLWFSPDAPISFTNKTDLHDITEILLSTINQPGLLKKIN